MPVISFGTAKQLATMARNGRLGDLGSLLQAIIRGQAYSSGAGSPNAVVTPESIGQRYWDTTNSRFYTAHGLTNVDWVALGARSVQIIVPVCGNAKAGATAGWVITGGTNMDHATLPASQTNSTLVVGLMGLLVGDMVTAVAAAGQVESAGGIVTITMSVRKLTNAAADNTDAQLAADDLGAGVTADTILSAANLGVTGLTEVMAADEKLYCLFTGTTAAATDVDLTHLLVSVNRLY